MGKIKARRRGYKDPTKATLNTFYSLYKNTSRLRGYAFRLSKTQFIKMIKDFCHYCGSPPANPINPYLNKDGTKRRSGTTISRARAKLATTLVNGLDRVDNRYGYVLKNVVTACIDCNSAKSNRTLLQFEAWLDRISKYRRRRNK